MCLLELSENKGLTNMQVSHILMFERGRGSEGGCEVESVLFGEAEQ